MKPRIRDLIVAGGLTAEGIYILYLLIVLWTFAPMETEGPEALTRSFGLEILMTSALLTFALVLFVTAGALASNTRAGPRIKIIRVGGAVAAVGQMAILVSAAKNLIQPDLFAPTSEELISTVGTCIFVVLLGAGVIASMKTRPAQGQRR